MPKTNEARSLWIQMVALERTRPGAQEDKEAFFKNKGKEMAKLKAAYDEATGLKNPTGSIDHNEALSRRSIRSKIAGKPDSLPTSDG